MNRRKERRRRWCRAESMIQSRCCNLRGKARLIRDQFHSRKIGWLQIQQMITYRLIQNSLRSGQISIQEIAIVQFKLVKCLWSHRQICKISSWVFQILSRLANKDPIILHCIFRKTYTKTTQIQAISETCGIVSYSRRGYCKITSFKAHRSETWTSSRSTTSSKISFQKLKSTTRSKHRPSSISSGRDS